MIRLAINGQELMLSGRFDHWVPVAMEGNGAGGAAQLFFDVTGLARGEDETEELFSFSAEKVERIADLAFVAKGVMRQGDVERPVDAVIQTPPAHTPFVAITFPLDQGAFPEIWNDLAALVSSRGKEDPHLYPRAWMVAPTLAAA